MQAKTWDFGQCGRLVRMSQDAKRQLQEIVIVATD